LSIKETCFI